MMAAKRISPPAISLLVLLCVLASLGLPANSAGIETKLLKAAAIGVAVNAVANPLNKAINTVTFQGKAPYGVSTKVVPILSVGEKAYVGAAQVAGPSAYVKQCKVIYLYEDNFSQNEFRLKVLVPGASINPLAFKRVQKVGISAVIDVALDGRWHGQTVSRKMTAGDVVKAGAVAVAITAAAKPLNNAINAITKGLPANTKVVPILSIGDKAYIGGVQISGSSAAVSKVKTVYQYEDLFDGGKYRIKAFVPSAYNNPLKFTRVQGIGITALIDTSIADQQQIEQRKRVWWNQTARYPSIESVLKGSASAPPAVRPVPARDNGLHKGWYKGVGNQRRALPSSWIQRYRTLPEPDRAKFPDWWDRHQNEPPDRLERSWQDWRTACELERARTAHEKGAKPGRGHGKK